jgi:hypothetical protein
VDAVTTFTAVGGHDTYTPLHFVYKKSARRTSNFKHNPAVDQPTAPLLNNQSPNHRLNALPLKSSMASELQSIYSYGVDLISILQSS